MCCERDAGVSVAEARGKGRIVRHGAGNTEQRHVVVDPRTAADRCAAGSGRIPNDADTRAEIAAIRRKDLGSVGSDLGQ